MSLKAPALAAQLPQNHLPRNSWSASLGGLVSPNVDSMIVDGIFCLTDDNIIANDEFIKSPEICIATAIIRKPTMKDSKRNK